MDHLNDDLAGLALEVAEHGDTLGLRLSVLAVYEFLDTLARVPADAVQAFRAFTGLSYA